MGVFDAKTSQKGQVTVPAEVRKALGLPPGGRLQFRIQDDGRVVLVAKKRGISHLKGIIATPDAPIDIDAEIMAEVLERNEPGSHMSRS